MMEFYKSEKVLFDAVNKILTSNEKPKDSDGKLKQFLDKINI